MTGAYGKGYAVARAQALNRSNRICQFCGLREATDAHHWQREYSLDGEVTSAHLTALCVPCHKVATALRRAVVSGASSSEIVSSFQEAIDRCYLV